MELTILNIILIILTGALAGFLNAVAGGGSLLTLPMMIFLGLDSAVANGTNRIALVVQNITAVLTFKKKGFFDWKLNIFLGIPGLFGSIIGAMLAISISNEIFNKILAMVMLIVLFLTLWDPTKKIKLEQENLSFSRKMLLIIIFFFIGMYSGFLQAGIGFVIIATLALVTGMSLVKINSIKVFTILAYVLVSLAVFLWQGKVDWLVGIFLAAGNSLGAWLGSTFSVAKGDKWIRIVLVIAVLVMSIKLLFS